MTRATGVAVIRSGVALMFSQQMTTMGAKYSLRLVLGLVSFLTLLSVMTSPLCPQCLANSEVPSTLSLSI